MSREGFGPARAPLTRQRIVEPIRSWIDNRLRWRHQRRIRQETARLEAFAVPFARLEVPMTPPVRRLAVLLEQLPSTVLVYGYGRAEALAVAVASAPDRIDPLIAALKSFTDGEILGHADADRHRARVAVGCRDDLIAAVRDVVSTMPKPGVGG